MCQCGERERGGARGTCMHEWRGTSKVSCGQGDYVARRLCGASMSVLMVLPSAGTGLIILTCSASQACITRGHKAGDTFVNIVTTVLFAFISGHLRAIKWCQTCSQLMFARPDVHEITMQETKLLGLAKFKRHPKQMVFKYVIYHISRASWSMRSGARRKLQSYVDGCSTDIAISRIVRVCSPDIVGTMHVLHPEWQQCGLALARFALAECHGPPVP